MRARKSYRNINEIEKKIRSYRVVSVHVPITWHGINYARTQNNEGLLPMPYGEFSARVTATHTGPREGAKMFFIARTN